MIALRKEFKRNGNVFYQLFRDDKLVLYRLSSKHADDDGVTVWYELFRYRINPPGDFRKDYTEAYPSDESFGQSAWSCSNAPAVLKVIDREFHDHWVANKIQKYACGTYTQNGETRPLYKITDEELEELFI